MSNPAGLRTVQNRLEHPGGAPIVGRQVSIKLNTPSFIDAGAREKERKLFVTTDSNGLWSHVLEVNADIDPAGTYYTVSELSGVIWSFIVPAGDPTVPINLRDCIIDAPTNSTPTFVTYGFGDVDGGSASSVYTLTEGLDFGSAA